MEMFEEEEEKPSILIVCEECNKSFNLKTATKRPSDGRYECTECGMPQMGVQTHLDVPPRKREAEKSEKKDTTLVSTKAKVEHPKAFCGECGAEWPWVDLADEDGKYIQNCGHPNAKAVSDPKKAKKYDPPAGHPRPPVEQVMQSGPLTASVSGNRLSMTWGESQFSIDQHNRFKVGQVVLTVEFGPKQDIHEVGEQMLQDLEVIADLAFDHQAGWYRKKLKKLGYE